MTATSILAATNVGETVVFWVCAILAVTGALGMLLSRKPVHSALFLAMTMVNLAIIYISLQAQFLGMVQVIVYTGAVMMLFLFVLMIVGVDASDSLVETIKGQRWASILIAVGFGILLIGAIGNGLAGSAPGSLDSASALDGGNVQGIAHLIFTKYVLAFEVTSALLITAALGAVVLAHRELHTPKLGQKAMSIERFKLDTHPGNLPAAGSYARHNAVDTPALLPDGTAAEISVPGPLRSRGSLRPPNEVAAAEVIEVYGSGIVAGEAIETDSDSGRETQR